MKTYTIKCEPSVVYITLLNNDITEAYAIKATLEEAQEVASALIEQRAKELIKQGMPILNFVSGSVASCDVPVPESIKSQFNKEYKEDLLKQIEAVEEYVAKYKGTLLSWQKELDALKYQLKCVSLTV